MCKMFKKGKITCTKKEAERENETACSAMTSEQRP